MRILGFTIALILASAARADISPWPDMPASESEMALIYAELGFDAIDEEARSLVLTVEGFRSFIDAERYNLVGELWLKPVLAQGGLCILTNYEILGKATDSGFEWFEEHFASYLNWLADDESGCEIDSPSEAEDALTTYTPLPSDSLVKIIEGSDRLIESLMNHPDTDARFRDDKYTWSLSSIRLQSFLDPELGFPYEAMLGSPEAQSGPTVTFSIEGSEFVIHRVGMWMF